LKFQERIIFVSFLAAQIGLAVITNAFPRVKIVTSMVDPNFNRKKLWIEPGIGNFGGKFLCHCFKYNTLNSFFFFFYLNIDRYFGTEEDDD
jgi:hypothetical protein